MGMTLWIDMDAEQAISLGNPFHVYQAFAEMSRAAGSDHGWADLFSVPQFAEQEVPADWISSVREQAARFLAKYDAKLSEQARWILKSLSDAPVPA
jgi:hypothetical protein